MHVLSHMKNAYYLIISWPIWTIDHRSLSMRFTSYVYTKYVHIISITQFIWSIWSENCAAKNQYDLRMTNSTSICHTSLTGSLLCHILRVALNPHTATTSIKYALNRSSNSSYSATHPPIEYITYAEDHISTMPLDLKMLKYTSHGETTIPHPYDYSLL